MTNREFLRQQKYGVPQLPAAREYQRRLAAEKYVRITPKPAPPPQPETLRDIFLPAYSSLTTLEREMGFTAGDIVAHGHKFRVLYYHGYPIELFIGRTARPHD